MAKYAIEGRDGYGNWSDDAVCSGGRAVDVNRFPTRAAAEAQLKELAEIFDCPTSDLRVVEVVD